MHKKCVSSRWFKMQVVAFGQHKRHDTRAHQMRMRIRTRVNANGMVQTTERHGAGDTKGNNGNTQNAKNRAALPAYSARMAGRHGNSVQPCNVGLRARGNVARHAARRTAGAGTHGVCARALLYMLKGDTKGAHLAIHAQTVSKACDLRPCLTTTSVWIARQEFFHNASQNFQSPCQHLIGFMTQLPEH